MKPTFCIWIIAALLITVVILLVYIRRRTLFLKAKQRTLEERQSLLDLKEQVLQQQTAELEKQEETLRQYCLGVSPWQMIDLYDKSLHREQWLNAKEHRLKITATQLQTERRQFDRQMMNKAAEQIESVLASKKEHPLFAGTLVFRSLRSKPAEANTRLLKALYMRPCWQGPLQAVARVAGSHGEQYKVTLNSCTCPDFQFRGHAETPCKHMYALALALGLSTQSRQSASPEQKNPQKS